MAVVLGYHLVAELLFKVMADDEYYLAEARTQRVIDRIIHYRLAGRPHAVQLLETTVAAAHAGSQDKECWFHIVDI